MIPAQPMCRHPSFVKRSIALSLLLAVVLALTLAAPTLSWADTYENWKAQVFTPNEQLNPNVSDKYANPTGDGVSNLVKYALGLNPHLQASSGDLPQSSVQYGYLYLNWFTSKPLSDLSDISCVVEVSSDLINWQRSPDIVTDPIILPYPQGSGDRYGYCAVALNPVEQNAGSLFMRLTITPQDPVPPDPYSGFTPTLTMIAGGEQRGDPGSVLSVPITVRVNSDSYVLQNAPLTFTITQGGALLATSGDPLSSTVSSVVSQTDWLYHDPVFNYDFYVARVYVRLPPTPNDFSVIQVKANKTTGPPIILTTTVASTDPSLVAPTDLSATPTSLNTVNLAWSAGNPSKPTTVQASLDGGVSWFTLGHTAPGITAINVTGLVPGRAVFFRVLTTSVNAGDTYDETLAFPATPPPASAGGGGSLATPPAAGMPLSQPVIYGEIVRQQSSIAGASGFTDPFTAFTKQVRTNNESNYRNTHDPNDPPPPYLHQTTLTTIYQQDAAPIETHDPANDYNSVDFYYPNPYTIIDNTHKKASGTIYFPLSPDACDYDIKVELSEPSSKPDFIAHAEANCPSFTNVFEEGNGNYADMNNYHDVDYRFSKTQYKWKTHSDPKGLVFWHERFFPLNGGPITNSYRVWKTAGATESPVYLLDPTMLNDKKNGSYLIANEPVDNIQIEAFIPQEYVMSGHDAVPIIGPILGEIVAPYPLNGNYRKVPLDGEFTSGRAVFIQDNPDESLKFKLFESSSIVTFPKDNAEEVNGGTTTAVILESQTNVVKQGETRAYATSAIVNGHLSPNTPPARTETGDPGSSTPDIQHIGPGKVQITLAATGDDPLVVGANFAPISWRLTITIDRSDPGNPTYTVTGTHKRFPAYGIWINGQPVHQYDPIKFGRKPPMDLLDIENVNEQGPLNY